MSDAVNTAQSQSNLVHASVGSGLYVTAVGAAIAIAIVGALVKNGESKAGWGAQELRTRVVLSLC